MRRPLLLCSTVYSRCGVMLTTFKHRCWHHRRRVRLLQQQRQMARLVCLRQGQGCNIWAQLKVSNLSPRLCCIWDKAVAIIDGFGLLVASMSMWRRGAGPRSTHQSRGRWRAAAERAEALEARMAVALFRCCNGGSNGNEITDLLEKKTSAFTTSSHRSMSHS